MMVVCTLGWGIHTYFKLNDSAHLPAINLNDAEYDIPKHTAQYLHPHAPNPSHASLLAHTALLRNWGLPYGILCCAIHLGPCAGCVPWLFAERGSRAFSLVLSNIGRFPLAMCSPRLEPICRHESKINCKVGPIAYMNHLHNRVARARPRLWTSVTVCAFPPSPTAASHGGRNPTEARSSPAA